MTIFLKVSHEVLLFILVFFLSFQYPSQILGKDCTSLNKVPICHKGGGVHEDHKGVSICVDFGALWGHIAQHPHDQIGECAVNIEENLKVWACNAGLRHQDHSDSLCFDMNQGGYKFLTVILQVIRYHKVFLVFISFPTKLVTTIRVT